MALACMAVNISVRICNVHLRQRNDILLLYFSSVTVSDVQPVFRNTATEQLEQLIPQTSKSHIPDRASTSFWTRGEGYA